MPRPDMIPLIAVAIVTVIAAATDLRRFKVYNALTFPALAGGLVASAWLGGFAGLGTGLLGAATGFAVLVVFYALGGVGAGDVKLFAALGAWLGPRHTLELFFAASVAGAAYALILAAMQGGLGIAYLRATDLAGTLLSPWSWSVPKAKVVEEARRPDRRRRLVPFAAMTCLGFFALLAYHHFELGRNGGGSHLLAASSAPRGGASR